jgi:hypothetical protein
MKQEILGALGLGLGVLIGVALGAKTEVNRSIRIPLHPYIMPHDNHITGIDYKIGPFSDLGLIDSGASAPVISQRLMPFGNMMAQQTTESGRRCCDRCNFLMY